MSAFLCSQTHISTIACRVPTGEIDGLNRHRQPGDPYLATAADIFAVLLKANLDSVAARYGAVDEWAADALTMKHCFIHRPAAAVIIKAVQCFEYQSCEFDGWDNSLAHAICRHVFEAAIRAIPGYEEAPWGIPDPTPVAR